MCLGSRGTQNQSESNVFWGDLGTQDLRIRKLLVMVTIWNKVEQSVTLHKNCSIYGNCLVPAHAQYQVYLADTQPHSCPDIVYTHNITIILYTEIIWSRMPWLPSACSLMAGYGNYLVLHAMPFQHVLSAQPFSDLDMSMTVLKKTVHL